MEKLLKILNGLRSDVDFKTAAELVDSGVLDSFDIVTLVMEINEAFDIEIGVLDITPENFNSAQTIMNLIESLS